MSEVLRDQWSGLLRAWDVAPTLAESAFDEVATHYRSPGRYYHTLDHILEVLRTTEQLSDFMSNPNAIRLAAWLHDVIYNSRASDNEEHSAAFARELCRTLNISSGPHVEELILKTKSHDAGEDPDAKVLLDADLAVLGANESVYQLYAANIRREYEWVPEQEYRVGRMHVLERFLARPHIFHFLKSLELVARRNIAEEIDRLSIPI